MRAALLASSARPLATPQSPVDPTTLLVVLALLVAIVVLVAIWLNRDAKRRGANNVLWVSLWVVFSIVPIGIIPGLVVLFVYFVTRGPVRVVEAESPGIQAVPRWGAPGPERASLATSPPHASPTTLAAPGAAPIPTGRVRCPRCQTIFEYQRMPAGPTHVKCPGCGEEGNI